MAQLNQRHIDGLKHHPDRKVRSRTESGLTLVLGKSPSLVKSWELTYYLDDRKQRYAFGRYEQSATGDSGIYGLSAARTERDRLKGLVRQGTCPRQLLTTQRAQRKADDMKRTTFADLRERFNTEYLVKRGKKSAPEILRTLKTKFSQWDTVEVKAITRAMIVERLDEIEQSGQIARNRAHSYLSSLLSFAVEKSVVGANNASGIRKLEEKARERNLTDSEIRYFWQGVDQQGLSMLTVIALRLILITGQRSGEVLAMKHTHLSDCRQWWTQPDSKNGRAHKTYLTPVARDLIEQAAALSPSDQYVFGSNAGGHIAAQTLSKAIKRWVDNEKSPMQIPAFTPHDLRRTMATNLGRLEVERFAQDRILNHKDRSIGAIYDVSDYDALKRRTMPLWDSRLISIIEKTAQDNNVIPLHA